MTQGHGLAVGGGDARPSSVARRPQGTLCNRVIQPHANERTFEGGRGVLPPGLRLVLLDDVRGNPAAVADLDALALSPVADGLILLATSACRPTNSATAGRDNVTPAHSTSLQDVLGQGGTQLLSVL